VAKDFLNEIVGYKKSLLAKKKAFFNGWPSAMKTTRLTPYRVFRKEIAKPNRVNLIAEIKKASPSRGLIRPDFNALMIAATYAANGADAISVLTEDKYFLGKMSYAKTISAEGRLPVLLKDFIIDPVQVYEAFYNGASAILLIVAILDDATLKELIRLARQFDMDTLVEVHDESELERAVDSGADVIGVNNRNLRTFEVDIRVSDRLVPRIPKEKVIVVESGLATRADIERVGQLGAHAVLIGETFMRAENIAAKMKEIMPT